MIPIRYRALEGLSPGYFALLGLFGALVIGGIASAYYIEHHGHYVTGMSNQIVWGVPHVFAIFLIIAASGVLNVASIGSVFSDKDYKPLARLSSLLAVAFLTGGLAVLVLDLGRPDRLIVAMTYYNFKSIFAWNIFLYTGFFAVIFLYMWTLFERRMKPYQKSAGVAALLWRLILTTGTGSIFGFLVARQAYDAAIMAPLFIVMSFSLGLALFIVIMMAIAALDRRAIGDHILFRLKKLLGIFVAAALYFVFVFNITNLYAAEHGGIERFILLDGGVYTFVFWILQVGIGAVLPLLLFYLPSTSCSRTAVWLGCSFVLIGTFAQLYVIIIGGQAYPLVMFPGMEESSSFFDGVVAEYIPSLPEIILGIGGVGLSMVIIVFALTALDFFPQSLADKYFFEPSD